MLHLLKRHLISISAFFPPLAGVDLRASAGDSRTPATEGACARSFSWTCISRYRHGSDGAPPAQFPSRGHGAGFLLERLSDLHATGQRSAIEARVKDLAQRHRSQANGASATAIC